jgi:hypothetical protein
MLRKLPTLPKHHKRARPRDPAPRRPNIADHSYDPDAQALTVTFHDGRKYRYQDVTPDIASGFKDAPSQGKFLHQHVHGLCKSCKVED